MTYSPIHVYTCDCNVSNDIQPYMYTYDCNVNTSNDI